MIGRLSSLRRRLHPPRSLRGQLLAVSLLILSGLLLLIGVLQYVLMRNFLYTSRAEAMQAQIGSVPRELYSELADLKANNPPPFPEAAAGSPPGGMRSEGRRPLLLDAHTTIALYKPGGAFTDLQAETAADKSAPRMTDEEYNQLLIHPVYKVSRDYRLLTAADGTEHLAVFMVLGPPYHPVGVLQMTTSTAPLRDVIMSQLLIYAALSAAALLGGSLLYFPALRRTLVPLSNMGRTARVIDAGNLDVRFLASQGQAEIDKLSHSFNAMLERLETSFRSEREAKEQMRRFAADASHELRTPLTSIHGFLEVLLRGAAENKDQLYNALSSMHGESRRINKLVEDLLLLARMDAAPQLRAKELCLGEIIEDMRPQLEMLAGDREVVFDLSGGIRGMYDPDKIKQVVLNLFQNAVQYTDPATGRVTVSLHASGSRAELTVRDNGAGIAAEHIPHVFDRFYRSDPSRARRYGGSGLGLSISKSIAEAHGGEIGVASVPGEGTAFRVILPCLQAVAKDR